MDVKISTIVSRFAFPLSTIHDDEGDNFSNGAAKASAGPVSKPKLDTFPRYKTSAVSADGMNGEHAFASVASPSSALSSISSLDSSSPQASGQSRARGKDVVDLMRLASSTWNTELVFGNTSAAGTRRASSSVVAPTACVLRPPPFVVDNTAYRAPTVYVLPSGVVRLMTYGSVHATHHIAYRIQRQLREAYVPAALRTAAQEERRLLQFVFYPDQRSRGDNDDSADPFDEGFYPAHHVNDSGKTSLSLAAALAGSDQDTSLQNQASRSARLAASRPASAETTSTMIDTPHQQKREAEGLSDFLKTSFKLDFVQSVASPRWDEIAGLREHLFKPKMIEDDKPVLELNDESEESGDGNATLSLSLDDLNSGSSDLQPSPSVAVPVPVSRASVNVRGDAPLAWWRWFLAASNAEGTPEMPFDLLHFKQSTSATTAAASTARPLSDEEDNVTNVTQHHELTAEERLWTCAAHRNVSPSSPAAHEFVRYLQRKRQLVAHHVVSFKIRRNATQEGIQLLLEWNAAPPPPPPLQSSLTQTITEGLSFSSGLPRANLRFPLGNAVVRKDDGEASTFTAAGNVSGTSKKRTLSLNASPLAAQKAQNLPITSSSSSTKNDSSSQHGEAWVTDASAANFFLESTFIAESTMPYGMESTRPLRDTEDAADSMPSLCRSRALDTVTAANTEVAVSHNRRDQSVASSTAVQQNCRDGLNEAAGFKRGAAISSASQLPLVSAGSHGKRSSRAKAEPVVTTEQVSCMLHRTGVVQLSTGSDVAIRQVCDALLLPFLVATAEIVLCRSSAACRK